MATYECPWCSTVSDGASLTCSGCGVSIDIRKTTPDSGWIELPGRKDMSKIQFGGSSCQIEGAYSPVADFKLAAGDGVYFSHHELLWMDALIKVRAMTLKGAWKRMFAGLPLIMTEAHGPGRIAFSKDQAGELIALPIQKGGMIDVREHVFLVATGHVAYDWFSSDVWFVTKDDDDSKTHYPLGVYMDRFSAPQQNGLLLIHARGNAFVRKLSTGESILIKPTALLFKEASVRMHLHFEFPASSYQSLSWMFRHLWLKLYGPGRIAIQSAFEPIEDTGRAITTSSAATNNQW